jgi:Zn-dependent M32 family carboxypeptidase
MGQGALLPAAQLVMQATGSALATTAFEEHVERRYLKRQP